jgi:hypothetical protein
MGDDDLVLRGVIRSWFATSNGGRHFKLQHPGGFVIVPPGE